MKRRLYPVVKHGSRFVLVASSLYALTLLVMAANKGVFNPSIVFCGVFLVSLVPFAFGIATLKRQSEQRRLAQLKEPAKLLIDGADAIEAGTIKL